jgi:hypothetical protein
MKTILFALVLSFSAVFAHAETSYRPPLLTGEFTAGIEGKNQITVTSYEDGTMGITTSGMLEIEPVVPKVLLDRLDEGGPMVLDIDGYWLTISFEFDWTRYVLDLKTEQVQLTPVF